MTPQSTLPPADDVVAPSSASSSSSSATVTVPTGRRVLDTAARHAMLIVLVVVVVTATITYNGFLTVENMKLLLLQYANVGLIAVGLTFLIMTGAFDLSVVPVFVAGATVFCRMAGHTPWELALLLAVMIGLLAGAVNAFVVIRLKVNSFMATLATASVFSGILQTYLGTNTFTVSSNSARVIGTGSIIGVPVPVIILVVALAVGQFVLANTTYGRSLTAVGGNEEAARLAGIRVGWLRFSAFALVGVAAACSGVIYGATVGIAQSSVLVDQSKLVLDAIAIVVVGGTSLFGGEGAMWRTAVGILIFATLSNVFIGLNTAVTTEAIVQGLVVIAAVAADAYSRGRNR